MILEQEDVMKLIAAIVVGGLIGAEREFRDRAAGFRTIILICTGATLFTIFSVKLGGSEDPVRIAANIVTGVGFLGAGVLLRESGRIIGLTTAATIWLSASLGMGIGAGAYAFTGLATLAVLIVLWVFPFIEHRIEGAREAHTYEVTFALNYEKFRQLEAQFSTFGLRVRSHKQIKKGEDMIALWDVIGSPSNHDRAVEHMFADAAIKEFRF
jgi:putative Mg2+ transporter-C (MgtC) family protein